MLILKKQWTPHPYDRRGRRHPQTCNEYSAVIRADDIIGRVARTLSGGIWVAHTAGFRVGLFDLGVPSFYPLTRSIGTSPASPLA